MDRSKPFRRLLPAGIVSVAGLTGCMCAHGYRPLVGPQQPASPPITAKDSTANSSTPSASTPLAAPAATESAGPAVPPPITVPAPPTPPAAPAPPAIPPQSGNDPATGGGRVSNAPEVQPYLNAPMGVLQTPLPSSEAPAAAPPAEALELAPKGPTDTAAPAQPSVSVNVDVEHGNANGPVSDSQKPAAAKKSKPKKPDPPPSPLARLRARFHAITHPPSKPALKREADETTTHATHLVTGSRVPLPTPEVAAKIQTSPVHGLYASDDAQTSPPVAASQAPPADPSTQSPAPAPPVAPETVAAASNPTANATVDQWPHSAPAQPASEPPSRTADSSDEFTGFTAEEYRATVSKIERRDKPIAADAPAGPSDDASIALPQWTGRQQSVDSSAPHSDPAVGSTSPNNPALGSTAPNPAPGEAGAMMVIPQAVPRPDRLQPAPPSGESATPNQAAGFAGSGDGIRDAVSGTATSAGWSPVPQYSAITPAGVAPVSNAPAADPNLSPNDPNSNGSIPSGTNGNPDATFNPGWSLPPAAYEEPARGPGLVAPPANVSPTSGRYGQPVWMLSAQKPTSAAALPAGHPMRPVLIERTPSPAPTIITLPSSAAHGGS
jgi:hypothetical protein